MVGDFYRDTWQPKPWFHNFGTSGGGVTLQLPSITREEFDELKRQVLEMKELLKRAKDYDERNGEPECEVDDKMELLRKIAAAVGVNIDDVLKK